MRPFTTLVMLGLLALIVGAFIIRLAAGWP